MGGGACVTCHTFSSPENGKDGVSIVNTLVQDSTLTMTNIPLFSYRTTIAWILRFPITSFTIFNMDAYLGVNILYAGLAIPIFILVIRSWRINTAFANGLPWVDLRNEVFKTTRASR